MAVKTQDLIVEEIRNTFQDMAEFERGLATKHAKLAEVLDMASHEVSTTRILSADWVLHLVKNMLSSYGNDSIDQARCVELNARIRRLLLELGQGHKNE